MSRIPATHHQPHQPRHLASAASRGPAWRTVATDCVMERRQRCSGTDMDPGTACRVGVRGGRCQQSLRLLWTEQQGTAPHRSSCAHGSGDRHFLLKAQLPAQSCALIPPASLPDGGPVFCRPHGQMSRAWQLAQNTHLTSPWSWRIPQAGSTRHTSLRAAYSLTARFAVGGPSTLHSEAMSNTFL